MWALKFHATRNAECSIWLSASQEPNQYILHKIFLLCKISSFLTTSLSSVALLSWDIGGGWSLCDEKWATQRAGTTLLNLLSHTKNMGHNPIQRILVSLSSFCPKDQLASILPTCSLYTHPHITQKPRPIELSQQCPAINPLPYNVLFKFF